MSPLEQQLQDLKEELKLKQELLRLQKEVARLEKSDTPVEKPQLRVANGVLILPRTMTGKKLSELKPRIIQKTNFIILKRIASRVEDLVEDLRRIEYSTLTESEKDALKYSINHVTKNCQI